MKKSYLLVVLSCMLAMPLFAAVKHEKYITESSGNLYSYYSSWTPGSAIPNAAEDENFFIGRQRPLIRFTNTESDPIASETKRNNRKLLWWVPINQTNDNGWRSLPAYHFDSEVFNMWSYIDIYGNWTQGFLRNPGAFTDVCHKNGVATSVVSTAAWAVSLTSTDGSHGQNYAALASGGYEKLLKMFHYYGIDGLGFNSEQDWGMRSDMLTLFKNCYNNKNNSSYAVPLLHFDMYQFSSTLSSSGTSGSYCWDDFFPYASGFFLNYNWSNSSLSSSASAATTRGGSSYDVYAGMDQQGGTAGFHWSYINNNAVSIGIWGAHNMNMLYERSTQDGNKPLAIQKCYLRRSEQFFTGGTQNPVNSLSITDGKCEPSSTFHGVNKLMAAKSALSWNTNSYFPFITYFNLGNGQFFKVEGETTYDNEWYNIGLQDFLPTWRWWITTAWRSRQTGQVPSDTHATFTWEDAWFGGSCMKITFDAAVTGSNMRIFHLFKTDFPLSSSDTWKLRIRYKVLSGSAVGFFAMSATGTETTAVTASIGTMTGATWQVKEVALPSGMVGKTMAMLGLQFRNIAAGTEILVGEMALYKEGVTYTPICPTLAQTKILKTTSKGVDFKVTWNSHIDGTSTAVASDGTCHDSGSSTITYQNPVVRNTSVCTMSGSMTNGGRRLSSINVKRGNTTVLSATTIQTSNYASIYTDKTGTTINVTAGTQYTLNATYSGQWMQGALFIDLNNDGDFTDDGELMSYDTTSDGTFQTAYTFTVPSSATNGTYTLRFIVLWYDNVSEIPAASCGQSSTAQNGGSITDFTINVTGGSGTGLPIETITDYKSEGTPTVYHPSGRNAWDPVYNDEVGTWYFEVWGQQCGKDPQLVTCTTSWAAYGVEVPFDLDGTRSFRVGVRAVAPDGVTKSDIQWSSYLNASSITILEGYSVDKPVIKPNENFTVAFDDVNHGAATYWKIYRSKDNTLMGTFNNVTSFTTTLADKGLYDVEVKYTNGSGATVTETRRAMLQVSGEEVGAMPEIYTLGADPDTKGITSGAPTVTFDLAYTGRPSEGSTSRALRLQESGFFTRAGWLSSSMNFSTSPFTIAFWFKVENYITNTVNLFSINSPSDSWPANNWGYIWVPLSPNGLQFCFRRQSANGQVGFWLENFSFTPGYWYHIAIVSNYNSTQGRNLNIYVNGALIAADGYISNADTGQKQSFTATDWTTDLYAWKTNNIFSFGGQMNGRSALDGFLDEIQIWNTTRTASQIIELMEHQTTINNNLLFYWDFESDPSDNYFYSTGKNTSAKGFNSNGSPLNGESSEDLLESSPYLQTPTIGAGSPFLAGNFAVTTTADWKFSGSPAGKGTPSAGANGADESGAMSVSYDTEGDYTATLTLENDYGKDTQTITVHVVDGTVGLDGKVVENLSVYPNPFTDFVILSFAKEGDYTVEVLGLDGKVVKSENLHATFAQMSRIAVDGAAGTYLVRIKQNGTLIDTLKIVKK